MIITKEVKTEFIKKRFSDNPVEERLLNIIVRGHFQFEDICYFNNYIKLDQKLYDREELKFNKKELAWLNHNNKFWLNLLKNDNARSILSKIHKRKFNCYSLSKDLKICHNAVNYWIKKFKLNNLLIFDTTASYGYENLYWLNTRDYPNASKFLLKVIEEKAINDGIEKAKKQLE